MSVVTNLKSQLREHVGQADLRLFTAIVEVAAVDDIKSGPVTADKATVIQRVEAEEGRRPSADVLRARIKKLNAAIAEVSSDHYNVTDPLLRLRSRKAAYVLEPTPEAIAQLEQQSRRRAVAQAAHEDRTEPDSRLVESRLAKPHYQVFISHAHETRDVEEIVDEFYEKLEVKTKSLPKKYSDEFSVSLWIDRKGMHGRADFSKQTDLECNRSAFGLFLTSDKWSGSPNCQREWSSFRDRPAPDRSKPYLAIQLTGSSRNLDEPLRSFPSYPRLWNGDFHTLVALWERGDSDQTERFVETIRDEICAHLRDHGGPTLDPEPTTSSPTSRRRALIAQAWEPDLREEDVVESEVRSRGETGDELDVADDSEPALPRLLDWATSPQTQYRILALLGGFGMGKTVAVQRLADALARQDDGPIPVYLDFRRLIPQTDYGRALQADLGTILQSAIGEEAAGTMSKQELIELIRSGPSVVTFDGLDEVGNRIGREHAAALFRQLVEIVPRRAWEADAQAGCPNWEASPVRLLVTCRTHFFRSLREESSTFTQADRGGKRPVQVEHMAPLSLERIEELFRKTLGETEGAQAFAAIRTVHDLPGLARRPIMARYIGETADELLARRDRGETINVATVYEQLFERALERDSEKVPRLTIADRMDVLKALALYMHTAGTAELDVTALERWFDRFAAEHPGIRLTLSGGADRRLLQTELRNASFLVRVKGDRFVFAHTSFYEYFLALNLLDACLGADLSAVGDRPPSDETIDFCWAAADQKGLIDEVKHALADLLRGDAPAGVRGLALRIQEHAVGDVYIPSRANLSNLDLRGRMILETVVWKNVRLDNAILTGQAIRGVDFRGVSFEGTWVGDTVFADCRMTQCTGTPRGASSARLHSVTRDRASITVFAGTRFDWPGGTPTDAERLKVQPDHLGPVTSVAFAPDGATCLTASQGETAHLWDVETGCEIRRFHGHGDQVTSVAIAPDGATCLTGSHDRTARLWDVATGNEIRRLGDHRVSVSSVAFAPDGATCLIGAIDCKARLWDVTTGRVIRRFDGHESPVTSVAFAPDGTTCITGSDDQTARLWDSATGREIHRFGGHRNKVTSVAFAPDGATCLTGSKDRTARLWDLANGRELQRFDGHEDEILSVAFALDGATCLTGSKDRTARLWDSAIGREIRHFSGHKEAVTSVAFAPNGGSCLVGLDDGTARLWDSSAEREIRRFSGHKDWVTSVAVAPDGVSCLTGSNDGIVRLWDTITAGEIRRFENNGHPVTSVAFAPNDGIALTGSGDGTARLWNTATGHEIRHFHGHEEPVTSVAFAPDGKTCLTGSEDRTARLWDRATGREIRRFETGGHPVTSVAFASDSATCLTGLNNLTARLWNCATGHEIRRFDHRDNTLTSSRFLRATRVAFAPDGSTCLTVAYDRTARLWNAATGREIRRFEGHGVPVTSVAFAPDGATCLTGSHDGTARLWDPATGQQIRRFDGHERQVSSVSIAPDGATCLTGSLDGTARLWDCATGEPIRIFVGLPESWAVLAPDRRMLAHGPNLWRYAHVVEPGTDRILAPDDGTLRKLEA